MTKEELIKELRKINDKLNHLIPRYDEEDARIEADDLLIAYINDEEITEAYENIPKWYG